MPLFHQKTKHSYISIRKNTQFLDWSTQPRTYKQYPHFYPKFQWKNYDLIEDFKLLDSITYKQEYKGGAYYLRTTPSAGALYPFELYVQIRGVQGFIDGIYHYNILDSALILLKEVGNDGVEAYFKNKQKQKGFIFLISSVYFRSSWKYHERAIRYILLDAGHQLGSIYNTLTVMQRECELVFDFDKVGLNKFFNFREDEMFLCGAVSAAVSDKEVITPKDQLAYVSPCDYQESNEFVYDAYKKSCDYRQESLHVTNLYDDVDTNILKKAILDRRSIRAFYQHSLQKDEFLSIMKDLVKKSMAYNLDIFYTIHLVDGVEQGLYKNGVLIKEGDFRSKSRYLALEQNIGGQSGVTFFFTSSEVEKYQFVNIMSGFIAQIIYTRCHILDIGCTGVGAYYDDEAKEFLQTKNNILYLLAIGR